MPPPRILSSYDKSINEISVLSAYMTNCAGLESRYQYFISEVIMLRLFAILETAIGEMAQKIACGATYKNGSVPVLLLRCSSMADAHIKLLSHGRSRPLWFLKWTNLTDIRKSIKYVLDVNDKFFTNINAHVDLIDEMRDVRNHIAHRNSGTAVKYYNQLTLIYNANLRLQIGAFLTSTNRHPRSNIERYLLSVPIILHAISDG